MHSTSIRFRAPSFWTLFWVLVFLHQLYFGWFLVKSSFVPYVMDGNETFSVWWHSHNLYTFSFWKSFGLTDEAFSFSEAAHPFFHTHQGNMPRLFGFLIYALGARTVESQVLATTLIIGNLTLYFCYASIAKIAKPVIAFVFCLFLFSDYLLLAQWHVVTYRVWYGFLFFGSLFAISSGDRSDGKIWPYVLQGGLFFLLFYFELVFAVYLSIICGLFTLWLHWERPKRIATSYSVQALGGVTALAVLLAQLFAALGADVVVQDFSATFLARNASVANSGGLSLVQFFQDHNIVFWHNFRDGSALRNMSDFLRSLGTAVFQIWTPSIYILVVSPCIGILVSFFEPRSSTTATSSFALANILPWRRYSSAQISQPVFGVGEKLSLYAGGATLSVGVALVIVSLLRTGALFGIPANSPDSTLTLNLIAALDFCLVVFVLGFYGAAVSKGVEKIGVASLFFIATILPAMVLLNVSLPNELYAIFAIGSRLTLALALLSLSFLAAGMAIGYFVAHSLLPVFRGTIVCLLISVVIAQNPSLFDQNYSEIWLAPFAHSNTRALIRVAALVTSTAGITIAIFGARRSFGPIWSMAIGRTFKFFFIGLFGYAAIYTLSPGYVLSGYAERLAPFAIFFMIALPVVAVCGLSIAGRRWWLWFSVENRPTWLVACRVFAPTCLIFAVAVVLLLWGRVQVYYAKILPPDHVEFAKNLSRVPFAGSTFVVSNYAAVVAYYGQNWASMDWAFAGSANATIDGKMQRRTSRDYIWFADWGSYPGYWAPQYYVCMKTPTFDSVLAQRDPIRYGTRFTFCDSEAAGWKSSAFDDRIVLADGKPARFWSVVALGGLRPKIDEITTTVQLRYNGWEIEGFLKAKAGSDHPIVSKTIELLVSSNESCDTTRGLEISQTHTGYEPFLVPRDFSGTLQLRAKAKSDLAESDYKAGDLWIAKRDPTVASSTLSRCPTVLADGPLKSSQLFDVADGWGGVEAWGVWSVGSRANLRALVVPVAAAESGFVLDAEVRGFVPGVGKRQSVDVIANGSLVANWTFSESNWHRAVTARIPKSVMVGHSNLSISFIVSTPTSPASLGLSADTRALGIGLEKLTIREDVQ